MAAAPLVYLTFPGTARAALTHYAEIFGGNLTAYTYAQFNRTDGPGEAIAHAMLEGPVTLAGSDAASGEASVEFKGLMLSLLGTADPETLHAWFDKLATNGTIIDPLAEKPWGACDGQVKDQYGVHWLIGYEPQPETTA